MKDETNISARRASPQTALDPKAGAQAEPNPEPMPDVLVEPSWAGRHDWREEAQVALLCLTLENPDMSKADLARALGLGKGRLGFAGQAALRLWERKYRRFLVARSRLGYVRMISPRWIGSRLINAHRFMRIKWAEYRALRAAFSDWKARG